MRKSPYAKVTVEDEFIGAGAGVENYIVRIYRREAGDPASVVGTVECVETRRHEPFHGLDTLGNLLASAGLQTVNPARRCPGPSDEGRADRRFQGPNQPTKES